MLVVKESGGGEMPYGAAVEGSFGAAGVNGVSSVAFAVYFALRNGKYLCVSLRVRLLGEFRWYRATCVLTFCQDAFLFKITSKGYKNEKGTYENL